MANFHLNMKTSSKALDYVEINPDYIKDLISPFCQGLDKKWINVDNISNYIYKSVKRTMPLDELYNYMADYCVSKISYHPNYNTLASRICIHVLHQKTSDDFKNVVHQLYNNIDINGCNAPLISEEVYKIVNENYKKIQEKIDYQRDYNFDYFAIKTLERSYLYKLHYIKNSNGSIVQSNKIVERPQHMLMRVALGIHGSNYEQAFESYSLMSNKYFTHATPTLFNAGSPRPQMSSCFLLYMPDSIDGIFNTIKDVAQISKWAGGIGIALSDIRAKGSIIRKTNGVSDGIIPLCRVLNMEAKYINQGGKRMGSFALYLEPWHADIYEFCEIRRNTKDESLKGRDLFVALWTCDLFMKRVKENGLWSLMCPDECPGLTSSYGEEFEKLYTSYEKQKKYKKQINAVDLWYHILECQIETGMPYMLYKDHANRKSNQRNLGTIKCSNLCVAPETKILTDEGYQVISEMVDKKVKVWNGNEFSEVMVKKTGNDRKLLKVTFSNGSFVECTENHKFHIQNKIDKTDKTDELIIEAKDLKIGSRLISYNLPIIDNNDNTEYKEYKFDVKNVPINSSIKTKLEWLSELTNNYCSLVVNRGYKYLKIMLNDAKLINDIFLMCTTLGINATMNLSREELLISPSDLQSLINMGFNSKMLNCSQSNVEKNRFNCDIIIESVKDEGRISDTYCFTEPLRHKGIFNGILTGQCTEIIEYTDEDTISVCNLASICLSKFVEIHDKERIFNFDKLIEVSKVVVRNLDIIIDKNFYPSPKAQNSNLKHRPIGIGIQGLADTYNLMGYAFDSKEASQLNKLIFESLYFGCVTASNDLAKKLGPYSSFQGSPSSEGLLQFHLWGLNETNLSGRYNWTSLVKSIIIHGLRNSLLTTIMPTASTAQIMGNSEGMDPYLSNIFTRSTLAGEFVVINGNLVTHLIELNLWSEEMRKKIIVMDGSIKNIKEIPRNIRNIYKTAFEIKLKTVIQLSIDRGPFIDQSQSLNLYLETSDFDRLTSAHFFAWTNGLKTGMYYLRSRPSVNPIQFGIEANEIQKIELDYSKSKPSAKLESTESQKSQKSQMCMIRPGIKVSECSMCT